jgi:hypothetical protein
VPRRIDHQTISSTWKLEWTVAAASQSCGLRLSSSQRMCSRALVKSGHCQHTYSFSHMNLDNDVSPLLKLPDKIIVNIMLRLDEGSMSCLRRTSRVYLGLFSVHQFRHEVHKWTTRKWLMYNWTAIGQEKLARGSNDNHSSTRSLVLDGWIKAFETASIGLDADFERRGTSPSATWNGAETSYHRLARVRSSLVRHRMRLGTTQLKSWRGVADLITTLSKPRRSIWPVPVVWYLA